MVNVTFCPYVTQTHFLISIVFAVTYIRNENEIFYHGGTAVAIEADLLSKEEIKVSLEKMIANVQAAGAGSIGLTMYPPYPEGSFKNKGMYPYGYQNGGDWTWFGGRMIQQLIRNGFVEEAYVQILRFVSIIFRSSAIASGGVPRSVICVSVLKVPK